MQWWWLLVTFLLSFLVFNLVYLYVNNSEEWTINVTLMLFPLKEKDSFFGDDINGWYTTRGIMWLKLVTCTKHSCQEGLDNWCQWKLFLGERLSCPFVLKVNTIQSFISDVHEAVAEVTVKKHWHWPCSRILTYFFQRRVKLW